MDLQNKHLSYYRLRLQELLNASFPEKAHDAQFIDQRSSWAANAYEGAFMAGNPVVQCDQIAQHILFEGLHFSRFDTIFQVVCNEFDSRMADEELRPFSLKMLSVCLAVFTNYKLTDDFAYSTDFEQLYTEVAGTISIWIEEHGLQ